MTAQRSSQHNRGENRRRWAVALVLIAIALGWWVFRGPIAAPAPPLDEHDAASRAKLDALVQEAERSGGSR